MRAGRVRGRVANRRARGGERAPGGAGARRKGIENPVPRQACWKPVRQRGAVAKTVPGIDAGNEEDWRGGGAAAPVSPRRYFLQ